MQLTATGVVVKRLRTVDLVYVKIFHEAKLQAFVKMQITYNQTKT